MTHKRINNFERGFADKTASLNLRKAYDTIMAARKPSIGGIKKIFGDAYNGIAAASKKLKLHQKAEGLYDTAKEVARSGSARHSPRSLYDMTVKNLELRDAFMAPVVKKI